jgi:hypothetical protein
MWARHRPQRRTISRTAVVACLALGAYGGLNAIVSGCTATTAVTAGQLDATVNRSTVVGGFADAYINVFLSAPTGNALTAFTSTRITPSALPVTVIKTAPWSVTPQPSGYANVDYWSVVIGAFVKPTAKAPELRFYQVPVAVVQGAPRAASAPAVVNGPDVGFDTDLDYPAQISVDTDAHQTVADFLSTWLTASGDISRYSVSPRIRPFPDAPFTDITVQSISAETNIPADAGNGFTTNILVTAEGTSNDSTQQTVNYPLVIVRQSDKWFISDIDLAPRLAGRIAKPTATPTPANSQPR